MISDMTTPQPYPLGCTTDDRTRYLVLGWTSEGNPVVVKDSPRTGTHHPAPKTLTEAVRYYLPGLSVSVDGEVSAIVDGQVSATVEGTKRNGAVLVYGSGD